jgi:hypothetical protein
MAGVRYLLRWDSGQLVRWREPGRVAHQLLRCSHEMRGSSDPDPAGVLRSVRDRIISHVPTRGPAADTFGDCYCRLR